MKYKPYIPQDISELLDHLAHMMLSSPSFRDRTGYFPQRSIDTAFFSLNEGLLTVRKKLGEEHYTQLRSLSDKMRTLFEADPDDKNGETREGRMLIHEMEDILRSVAKPRAPQ